MSFPVQSGVNTQAGGSITTSKAFPGNNTAGNILVAALGNYSGAGAALLTSLTDSAGNVYVKIGQLFDGSKPMYLYWCPSCIGGPNTVTATWAANSTFTELIIVEYAALPNAMVAAISTANSNLANVTSLIIGPISAHPGDILISYYRSDSGGAETTPIGFTRETSSTFSALADKANTTAVTFSVNWINAAPALPALGFLIAIRGGSAPSAFVQGNNADGNASSTSWPVIFTGAQTAGNTNLAFIILSSESTTVVSLSDTVGNVYSLVGSAHPGRAVGASQYAGFIYLYAAHNIHAAGAGANTVTLITSVIETNIAMAIAEYNNCNSVNPIDGWNAQVNAGPFNLSLTSDASCGTVATSGSNDTIVAFCHSHLANSITPSGALITRLIGTFSYIIADEPAITPGLYSPQFTLGSPSFATGVAVALSSSPGVYPQTLPFNGSSLLPQMGWDSWRYKATTVTQAQILTQAALLVSKGLAAAGYNIVNASDAIYTSRSGGHLVANGNFPNVLTMADSIRALGLQFAAYLAPGPGDTGCSNFAGSGGFELTDAALIASQGAVYLMYDACYDFQNDQNTQAAYTAMALALRATNHNIAFLCSCPLFSSPEFGNNVGAWCSQAGGNLAITAPDLQTMTYTTFLTQITGQLGWAQPTRPGRLNWLDYMGVGNGNMSVAEGRSCMAIWAILAQPLWISADLSVLSAGDLATLTNSEIIAVDQDENCTAGTRYSHVSQGGAFVDVWARPLTSGSWAVVLMNQASTPQTIAAAWSMFGASAKFTARDIINHVDLGSLPVGYTAVVASHDVAMLVLTDPNARMSPPPPPVATSVPGGVAVQRKYGFRFKSSEKTGLPAPQDSGSLAAPIREKLPSPQIP